MKDSRRKLIDLGNEITVMFTKTMAEQGNFDDMDSEEFEMYKYCLNYMKSLNQLLEEEDNENRELNDKIDRLERKGDIILDKLNGIERNEELILEKLDKVLGKTE